MELKMASTAQLNEESGRRQPVSVCNMESMHRISKLPVVESGVNTATNIYEKVKDYNSLTNWTLSTAESTVNKAIEVGKPIAIPVVSQFGGPIKKVDDLLCSGLDYVEDKVPSVKLPPAQLILQIYNHTKDYVNTNVTPRVQHVYEIVEPKLTVAKNAVEPAVKVVRHAVEPAVQTALHYAEPLVQPALDKVHALKEYGTQKVEEFFQLNQENQEASTSQPEAQIAECNDNTEDRRSPSGSPKSEYGYSAE